jgi:hypothetical protein
MLIPNMLSDFINIDAKGNFSGYNLLNISEKDTKNAMSSQCWVNFSSAPSIFNKVFMATDRA